MIFGQTNSTASTGGSFRLVTLQTLFAEKSSSALRRRNGLT